LTISSSTIIRQASRPCSPAGEKIDVSQSSPSPSPIRHQGLPSRSTTTGAADTSGFHAFTKQVATVGGRPWPAVLLRGVDLELLLGMLEKLKIDKRFAATRIHRALRKSKEDGVRASRPVESPASASSSCGHLVPDDLQSRWHLLRQQGNHMLGDRLGRPRDAEMVGQHLREGSDIADPKSLKVQFTIRPKAFGAARNLYRGKRSLRSQSSATIRRSRRSPARSRRWARGRRQDDRRHPVYFLVVGNATRNGRGSSCSILGGNQGGNYTQPSAWQGAMLGSGYTSV